MGRISKKLSIMIRSSRNQKVVQLRDYAKGKHLLKDSKSVLDELYRTPSNNTTRQWISDIFRFLEYSPIELSREPLEKMIKDKRFSYRLKKKMRNILSQGKYQEISILINFD